MSLFSDIALGFSVALAMDNLFYCAIGVLMGTLIGVLPGIGPLAAISMLLPLTYNIDAVGALIMLSGIYYGAQYGGSTTAILVNVPGESSSVVTALDGYKLARKGKAGTALAIAALGSFFAGSVATLLIAVLAKPLTLVGQTFGAAEYFSLMVLGLIVAVILARGTLIKALAMVVIGLMLGAIGTDVETGASRMTLGLPDLWDGVDVLALAIGLFALAEVGRTLAQPADDVVPVAKVGSLYPSREDLAKSAKPVIRGTILGSLLGLLPGGGAVLSSFVSYAVEKRISRNPAAFGHGAIEGVAGPEAANNAGAQTSFIPMLTLGLPANPILALLLGAMIIHGIQPGWNIVNKQPDLFWGLIASMWIGNAMLVIINLPLIGLWIRLLSIPYWVLGPTIVLLCAFGILGTSNSAFAIQLAAMFAFAGYVLERLEFEPAPLILGFILSPMLEENFRRALQFADGDFTTFFTRPISLAFLVVGTIMLLVGLLPAITRRRRDVFTE